ncbi:MAG: tyrosine-type recombinase/integrase [Micrococcales bacterium]|nr:tyrosine-type recombinase/integrase [Micrococcales bacterium]
MLSVAGSARGVLAAGVTFLDPASSVFEGMLTGWERQMRSRGLIASTVAPRVRLIRRFTDFADGYPWAWTAADVEDFTVSLMSGEHRLAPSTIRGYHETLRMFCDYVTDQRYEWMEVCADQFGATPSQVCYDHNTMAHLVDYEGLPARRPVSYDELQALFDWLDERVDRLASSGKKGALPALRDAVMIKTCYAFGLRRRELCMLDVADLRPNPTMPQWGTFGAVHVRYGKSIRGGVPRRRTVLAVPEFDWAIDGLRQWVEQVRPLLDPVDRPGLWLTERRSRVSVKWMEARFIEIRDGAGLDPALTLHCLRHSYVTHLVEHGYPERFVQEQVGHSYASTTAIYTSVSNDFKTKTLKTALARVYRNDKEES